MKAEDAKKRYDEKMKRVRDAIELRVPDRIPNIAVMEGFPAHYADVPVENVMRDFKTAEMVYDKFFTDFDPDLAWEQYLMYPLKALETLDFKLLNWPGPGRLSPKELYQFIETVTMYDGEFPEYTSDPTRYMMTKWIPRSFGNLKGLEKLSGMRDCVKFGWMGSFLPFADPEVQNSLKALMKGSEELLEWVNFLGYYDNKIEKEFGIPIAYASTGDTPFDMLSDSMRGTINILMDMYEYPEELLEALDAATPIAIESVVGGAKAVGRDFVWLWLHKGLDSFMSDKQYRGAC